MLTRTLRDPRVLPVVVGVVIVAALVLSFLAAVVGLPFWIGAVLGVVVGGGVAFAAAQRGRAAVVRGLAVATPEGDELARLENLLAGLTVGHGIDTPEIVLVDTDAVNACSVEGAAGVALVVTRGLVRSMSRIELEAVVAHELAQVESGETAVGSVLAGFASVAPGGLADRIVARMGDDQRVVRGDLAGVRLTRYPPGLVSALTRLASASAEVPGASRASAHLWLERPLGAASATAGATHPALDIRIDTLREL
ncbi:MAG: M48 family metalloprotease [Acidimicrobiales bacterium]|jgi:heat shock protein HtpX|nr:M48 family metalloprotease [Acidimicrobiales bacterium]